MLKIDQAFTEAFINGAFGLPVAHENLPYIPISGTAYCEIRMIPNDVTPASLAQTDQTDGIFRVWLRYPPEDGAFAIKSKADEILSAFPIGRRLAYDGQQATITRLSRQQGTQTDSGWYEVIISIGYWAGIER